MALMLSTLAYPIVMSCCILAIAEVLQAPMLVQCGGLMSDIYNMKDE